MEYDSYKVDLRDGIISNDIRTMVQDDKGYIWLGSTYGLVRYDGQFFHTYLSVPTGNNSLLPDNHIRELINWTEGLVVVRTQGAMCVLFDTRANRFVPFPLDKGTCSKYGRIRLDHQRALWLFDGKGRGVRIECKGRKFVRRFYAKENSVPTDVRKNKCDNMGNRYELIDNEYLKYTDKKRNQEYVFKIFNRSPYSSAYVRYNVLTVGDRIWVSTYGSGITIYNKVTGEQTHIRKGVGGTLQTNFIISIMADRQGNVWALQDMHGVVCISVNKKQQTNIKLATDPDDEQSDFVKSICTDENGFLLVGSNTGRITRLDMGMNPVSSSAIENDAPLSLLRLSTGEMAVGTRAHGICIAGTWYKHDGADPLSPSDNKIMDMAEDREGRIWMATQDGNLDVAIPNGNRYTFRHLLPQNCYRSVTVDHKGDVWAGGETMLYHFTPPAYCATPLTILRTT